MRKPGRIAVSVLAFSTYLSLLAFAPGCDKRITPPHVPPPNLLAPVSASARVAVYVDASGSIAGYVRQRDASEFIQTMRALRPAIEHGWEFSPYQFSTDISPISRFPEDLERADFFRGLQTNIESALAYRDSADVKVVVTDLFESSAYVDTIAKLLEQNCVSKGLALGIIGVKSSFEGRVFGVGIQRTTFRYPFLPAQPVRRPFYILILGKHRDVQRYAENVLRFLPFGNDQSVIQGPLLLSPWVTEEDTVKPAIAYVRPLPKKVQFRAATTDAFTFRILDGEQKTIQVRFPYERLRGVATAGRPRARVERVEEWSDRGLALCGDPGRLFEAVPVEHDDEGFVAFGLRIHTDQLGEKRVYRVSVVAEVDEKSITLPPWVASWTMNLDSVDYWRAHPEAFNGETTQYLNELFQPLAQKFHPVIARLYFDIRR